MGDSRHYAYDPAGDLTRYVDRNGVVRQYTYDSAHRVIGETWYASVADADAAQNATNQIEYAYDEAGRIVYEADAGSSVSYTYNDAGQITSTTSSSDGAPTVTLDYAYDADGNRTRMSATVDGVADFVEDYAYDDSGRVISVVQHGVDGGNAVAEKELVLDYDDEGRIISIDRYQDGQLAVEADYAYDERGRLISLLYHQGGTTLASYAWKYTDSGEPLLLEGTSNADWTPNGGLPSEFVDQGMLPVHDTDGVVDALMAGGYADLSRLVSCTSLDGTVTYSYDPTGQLTGADYSDESTPDESYTYDANGNRVTTNGYVYTTGPDNRLLSDGTYWYDYDAEGNRVARFIDVNVNGILDSGDTDVTKYTWDARNRLIHVADYPVEGASPEQMVDHVYDLENRWIGRLVDVDGDGTIDHRTAFVYDGNQIVLEFENNGAPDLAATDLSHRYLWQPDAIDQIMADEQITSPDAVGDVVWPLGDHLGTVRDLAVQHPETGETTIVNHITYDSFGNKVSEGNAAVDCLFGFTGRPLDDQTGLQNNLNRWYDGSTGQWLSKDAIGLEGRDANAYGYVGNSPANLKDSNGLIVVKTTELEIITLTDAQLREYRGRPYLPNPLVPTDDPHKFLSKSSRRVSYRHFADQSELKKWKADRSRRYRVAVAQLKGDQKSLANAAKGDPALEKDVATILNAIENTHVRPNVPILRYFLNEEYGSICAKWGQAFGNQLLKSAISVPTLFLSLSYEGGEYEGQEHFITLIGVGGKVFGVDQSHYGKADHIFEISAALDDEHLTTKSREELQEAVDNLLNRMKK